MGQSPLICRCRSVSLGWSLWVNRCGSIAVGWSLWIGRCGSIAVIRLLWARGCGLVTVGRSLWVSCCGFITVLVLASQQRQGRIPQPKGLASGRSRDSVGVSDAKVPQTTTSCDEIDRVN